MHWEGIKKFNEAYYPLKLLYVVIVLALWFVPYAIQVPSYWSYIPLFLLFAPTLYEALENLLLGKISTDLFMSIATVIALVGGEQSAIFIVLMILWVAHYLDDLIKKRTEGALSALIEQMPHEVILKDGVLEKVVPLREIQPGMQIVVKTGGRVPVDGTILGGEASVQESVLTGESIPLQKGLGELVFAGTYLEAGSIVVQVDRIGEDTLFGKIRILIDQAGKHKAQIVHLADRITRIFTPLFLFCIAVVWSVSILDASNAAYCPYTYWQSII